MRHHFSSRRSTWWLWIVVPRIITCHRDRENQRWFVQVLMINVCTPLSHVPSWLDDSYKSYFLRSFVCASSTKAVSAYWKNSQIWFGIHLLENLNVSFKTRSRVRQHHVENWIAIIECIFVLPMLWCAKFFHYESNMRHKMGNARINFHWLYEALWMLAFYYQEATEYPIHSKSTPVKATQAVHYSHGENKLWSELWALEKGVVASCVCQIHLLSNETFKRKYPDRRRRNNTLRDERRQCICYSRGVRVRHSNATHFAFPLCFEAFLWSSEALGTQRPKASSQGCAVTLVRNMRWVVMVRCGWTLWPAGVAFVQHIQAWF